MPGATACDDSELDAELLDELEALAAIYGDDVSVYSVDGGADTIPPTQTHTNTSTSSAISVRIRCGSDKKFELHAQLPRGYPVSVPLVSVGRVGERNGVTCDAAITKALLARMAESPHPETPVLFELISWVEEHTSDVECKASTLAHDGAPAAGTATRTAPAAAAAADTHGLTGTVADGAHPAINDTVAGAAAPQTDLAKRDHGRQTKSRQTVASNPPSTSTLLASSPPSVAIDRQWIWFIGFYTKSIVKAFCTTATDLDCTGFLMPGKPAVAAVEGTPAAIAEFLRVTRTALFARVPPASRKMKLCLVDRGISARAFQGFEEMELKAVASAHKRKDIADLGSLEAFLSDRGLSHAFKEIFDTAVK
jgi:hypothetical protein